MSAPIEILKQYWGYTQFRSPQDKIIDAVLSRQDVLAILPTGGGKSICFQVPALMQEGVCLVITPLIALMQDQVKQLKERGIPAVAVHAGMHHREIDITLDNCVYGKQKFLYLSPERLQTDLFKERVKKMNVSLVAIDEAHCISQWGYDFRPPYLKIAELRNIHPDVPFIALTASATGQVQADIMDKLQLKQAALFQKSFARDNLSLVIRKSELKEKKLLEILRKVPGSAIVYVRSRKATVVLATFLKKNSISATYYHAGLTHAERTSRQEEWITNRSRVMVATNAFGMGIDKADVRVVVHMDLPETLEAYYQEAGRAGRDGKRSYAAVLYHNSDIDSLQLKVEQAQPTLEALKKIYQGLANFFQVAMGSSQGESFDFDLEVFCHKLNLKSTEVYPALKKLEEFGLIEFNESFYRPTVLHFAFDNKKLYEFQVAHARFDPLIKALLRLYGGELYADFTQVSEKQVAQMLRLPEAAVKLELEQLHNLQVLVYEPQDERAKVTFVTARQDAERLSIDKKEFDRRRALHLSKMEAMVNYTTQTHRCRMQLIQEYFGEITDTVCGRCDVCIEKHKQQNTALFKDYEQQINYLLTQKPMTVDELELAVDPTEKEVFIEIVREMVDSEELYYDEVWVLHKR
ncbi:MAG: RecQ family ATP-dependent DNA helicase [Cyclobacteriaceae bacterium]|nr:RecQ family ATP-dependent DNA helicase [Cyclobacteriaceae bacterium]